MGVSSEDTIFSSLSEVSSLFHIDLVSFAVRKLFIVVILGSSCIDSYLLIHVTRPFSNVLNR